MDIRNLSYSDLEQYLRGIGEQPFRAGQLFRWLYIQGVDDFKRMTNVPATLIGKLEADFPFERLTVIEAVTAADETVKFLFRLHDGEAAESVLIPAGGRLTVCISTQVGCKFRCSFCASGLRGFKRNLSCAEIVGQVLAVQRSAKKAVTHVVCMGIGEPLDNYDNFIKALRIINAPQGMRIAARRITVSTAGVIEGMRRLQTEGLQVELAVSLHGSNDALRAKLMPIARRYPLKSLISACRHYSSATSRQITFEYILIKNVTCTAAAAAQLGRLLKGMNCKLNLIPYNAVAERPYEAPVRTDIADFKKSLAAAGLRAIVRAPRGSDINAACGQLRNRREHMRPH